MEFIIIILPQGEETNLKKIQWRCDVNYTIVDDWAIAESPDEIQEATEEVAEEIVNKWIRRYAPNEMRVESIIYLGRMPEMLKSALRAEMERETSITGFPVIEYIRGTGTLFQAPNRELEEIEI
jgi:hypothetical protein